MSDEKAKVISGMLIEPLISQLEIKNRRAGLSQRCLIYDGVDGQALALQQLPILVERASALTGVAQGIYLTTVRGKDKSLITFDATLTEIDRVIFLANIELKKNSIEEIPELPKLIY